MENNNVGKPRLYFRSSLRNDEGKHELGLIFTKKEVEDMISMLNSGFAFPEDGDRKRVCILIPGFFEKREGDGYELIDSVLIHSLITPSSPRGRLYGRLGA
jgi:hypothetical protein